MVATRQIILAIVAEIEAKADKARHERRYQDLADLRFEAACTRDWLLIFPGGGSR